MMGEHLPRTSVQGFINRRMHVQYINSWKVWLSQHTQGGGRSLAWLYGGPRGQWPECRWPKYYWSESRVPLAWISAGPKILIINQLNTNKSTDGKCAGNVTRSRDQHTCNVIYHVVLALHIRAWEPSLSRDNHTATSLEETCHVTEAKPFDWFSSTFRAVQMFDLKKRTRVSIDFIISSEDNF